LFDLDDTLVLSHELAELRRTRQWKRCYSEFGRSTLPTGTPAFLDAAKGLGRFGVVTTSHRTYAEKLLKFHNLAIDVLVAYHDVSPRKPDPAPIIAAAAKINVLPNRCVYIGDSDDDVTAAIRAGAQPIKVCWTGHNAVGVLSNWDDVLDQLRFLHQELSR
jgi:phosphoglycolate phosphatase-like HAD superfamily hydrolase